MTTVKTWPEQKPRATVIFSLGPDDTIVTVLQLMRDRRVRAVLVIEAERLKGIVTQGDCAIKVLLPGLDAKSVAVKDIMTVEPMTVKLADPMQACMGLMASRNFPHLPVVEADRVMGMVSIGGIVKDSIRRMGQQINHLVTSIMGHGAWRCIDDVDVTRGDSHARHRSEHDQHGVQAAHRDRGRVVDPGDEEDGAGGDHGNALQDAKRARLFLQPVLHEKRIGHQARTPQETEEIRRTQVAQQRVAGAEVEVHSQPSARISVFALR